MSNVVKSSGGEDYQSAVVFNFADVEDSAAGIVSAAQTEAAEITAAARKAATEESAGAAEKGRAEGLEAGRREGLEAGRQEGRKEAFEAARAQIEKAAEALGGALAEFSAMKDELFVQAERDLLKLSMLVARKVVAREVEADDHVTAENLKRCLDVLSNRKNITVRVAPSVLETMQECLGELAKATGELSTTRLEGDPDISPGGCVITASQGSLDARIETQFEELERILFGNGDE